MKFNRIGVILLAAGASVRLGKSKQLLKFRNQSLLRRSAETALKVTDQVVVTLGARSEITRPEIADLPVQIVENKDWETGMGSSLRIGLEQLSVSNEILHGVLIMVCDQPFVSGELLEKLAVEFETTNALIAACEYENTFGVPAVFSARLFPELLALKAEHGARYLIKKYRAETVSIPFSEGAFDIDTPDDYEKLTADFT